MNLKKMLMNLTVLILLTVNVNAAPKPTYGIELTWIQGSGTVIGNNIYRSIKPKGPFNKVYSSGTQITSYVDYPGKSGKFYYVVTSVGIDQESGYSNSVSCRYKLHQTGPC
jgi:hypothetical protein